MLNRSIGYNSSEDTLAAQLAFVEGLFVNHRDGHVVDSVRPLDFIQVSRSILHLATRGPGRIEFLREASRLLLQFSGCDTLELRVAIGQGRGRYRWIARRHPTEFFDFEPLESRDGHPPDAELNSRGPRIMLGRDHWMDEIIETVARGDVERGSRCVTTHGSVWSPDAAADLAIGDDRCVMSNERRSPVGSLAIIPFDANSTHPGVLTLLAARKHVFTAQSIEYYEALAQTLGLAIDDRRAQHALRERVKELTCLYAIAQILEASDSPVSDAIGKIVNLIPSAWQFPDAIAARIKIDEIECSSGDIANAIHRQEAPIRIDGKCRGAVEVGYVVDRPEFVEGAFLPEEQHLVSAIAREVAQFTQRRAAIEEKRRLAEQVRQADRLATIGQLAAGVAHEINEPLGGILGFAQLAKKAAGLPVSANNDLEKIIRSALHARTIVRKLMLFARQSPPSQAPIHLNAIAEESLTMIGARLTEHHVDVVRELDAADPVVFADAVQLHQLLVNLCVNGLQAMPNGGRLTVRTRGAGEFVMLEIEDSGAGIPPDIASRIFEPFFTTKEPEHGTGLGLSVVHGIVTSHGGTIEFASEPEKGTRFTVRLPTFPPSDTMVE